VTGPIVLAPLAYVETEQGVVEVEGGQPLPADAKAEHVAVLTGQGVVGESSADKAPAPAAAAASRRSVSGSDQG